MTESRSVYYDSDIGLEAYGFRGLVQEFPCHSHDYYVIGFVERSRRRFVCRGEESCISPGDVILIAPGESHSCHQFGEDPLDYRSLNIGADVMAMAMSETLGGDKLSVFGRNVVPDGLSVLLLRRLHRSISGGAPGMEKEELFLALMARLIDLCGLSHRDSTPESSRIKDVVDFLESNYGEPVTLDLLSSAAGISKYRLIRAFNEQIGISPHRYLETVRINRARKLLAEGMPTVDVAYSTGFHDQSHFSNCFKKLLGITPSSYGALFR
ncbi:MAG: AraC family transcriptional regulator [Dethiosulfovibrio sp.]|nr:AraC family transcriptional regulator [Dethiosulfovibrio sp.]